MLFFSPYTFVVVKKKYSFLVGYYCYFRWFSSLVNLATMEARKVIWSEQYLYDVVHICIKQYTETAVWLNAVLINTIASLLCSLHLCLWHSSLGYNFNSIASLCFALPGFALLRFCLKLFRFLFFYHVIVYECKYKVTIKCIWIM